MLATRFTVNDGYVIESRRGGGGYIRIVRVVQSGSQKLMYYVREGIGDAISLPNAQRIILCVQEEGLVTPKEAAIMRAALSDQATSLPIPEAMKDALRAKILKSMLLSVARQGRAEAMSRPCPPQSPASGTPVG